jgi:aryl-alcohol dehydrogenase-like predicted oxidoreductase
MDRREFLGRTTGLVTATWAGRVLGAETLPAKPAKTALPATPATQPAARTPMRASDTVTLGKTGIHPSRLALGTGSGAGKEQRDLGVDGLVRLFRHAFDQGIRWWETADMYKTHLQIKGALRDIKRREQVVVTTKTVAKTAEGVRADIERFRKELDTDYIDIVLLHCMEDGHWPAKMKGAMEALSEAKEKGLVRAVGSSCHGFAPLKAAANEVWGDVQLARFNPYAAVMDVNRPDQVPQVARLLESMHEQGKAIYAMKLIGAGTFSPEKIDATLRFLLPKPYISGFTIGFSRTSQIDDIVRRIDRIRAVQA